MTADALRPFVVARGDCEFSEVMAEGTDSWLNRANVGLDLGKVDLSGVVGLEEAKQQLKLSLTTADIEAIVAQTADGMHVALEGARAITFSF